MDELYPSMTPDNILVFAVDLITTHVRRVDWPRARPPHQYLLLSRLQKKFSRSFHAGDGLPVHLGARNADSAICDQASKND